ncbi:MAG: pyridoxal-phosphate dependent enzyme [Actinobacteria bacterium]|nr:pyridoxal-phosphate dependent enzyme [Actinomycetota bacterium]
MPGGEQLAFALWRETDRERLLRAIAIPRPAVAEGFLQRPGPQSGRERPGRIESTQREVPRAHPVAGVAAWFEGRVRVVGVEPETSACMHAALAAGEPVDVTYGGYAADSLGNRRAGQIAFDVVSSYVERVVLVPDDAIREAQRRLWDSVRLFAEPGGATAFAALLVGAYVPEPDERIVVLVCGANGDLAAIA